MCLRQNWRLQQSLLFFFVWIKRLTRGSDETRRHKDNQIALDVLLDIGPEETSHQRNVADKWCLILRLLNVFAHQPSKHHRLPIPDAHTRGHFACAKNRLINYVVGEANWTGDCNEAASGAASDSVDTHCIDGTAVIDETLELDNLWNKIQVDGDTIRAYDRFDFQSYAV